VDEVQHAAPHHDTDAREEVDREAHERVVWVVLRDCSQRHLTTQYG
jgi:hypothetical protein